MSLIQDIRFKAELARDVAESVTVEPTPSGDQTEWAKRDHWLNRGRQEAYEEVLKMLVGDE